ncbi:folate-binding protein YgfZ [Azospirillum sp. RWY-5-1]|uniref:Folate-binding protein YgfZ n=1 Tax=Azospirillum oleiclasticum TaxID=2735135 RepID=A0ABX2TMG3_9PROT|nr:folate-binding protein YgfZ [Azospirillum oleiclasticum]NYZ16994.1 folate-binding protein YgfZ [Azospirillum oleiclasticum]NYZ24563.1 folate-binding protein YgfZ [Azospirillum oleiclasticum]
MDNGAAFLIAETRGVLAVTGEDRVAFLQGLVSNDIRKAAPDRALYALFLTPQGKFLHDLFIAETGEALLLDAEAARRDDLLRRLRLYKLRSRIALEDRTPGHAVVLLYGSDALKRLGLPAEPGAARPFAGGVAYVDPRLPVLGARAMLPRDGGADALSAAGFAEGDPAAYDRLRLRHGVPDGSRDLVVEKAIPLENNLHDLNAIAWDKGCYMGQELTARTHYRALIRRRLYPVAVDGPLPAPGTPVMLGDREAGELRSGLDGHALALLRGEDVERARADGTPLTCGGTTVIPRRPDWASF